MGRNAVEYPQDTRNTVVRKGKLRGAYDLGSVHTIINSALVVHVSFSPQPEDPFPAILPMIGTMASFERPSAGLDEPLDCYLHGYVSSRIMKLTHKAIEEGKRGLPVCISASKVDGVILALTPNAHSYNYRSAVLFGYATLVTDVQEKLFAMEQITNKVVPNRWDNTRLPPNAGEMSSTQILRVEIESGSAKVRDGPPADDAVDLKNEEVLDRVWTGYIPLVEKFETPVPSSYNRIKEVPGYIEDYRKGFNEENEEYAKKVSDTVSQTTLKYGEL